MIKKLLGETADKIICEKCRNELASINMGGDLQLSDTAFMTIVGFNQEGMLSGTIHCMSCGHVRVYNPIEKEAAVNKPGGPYYWYWHDYRCRLEPWTYEWRRHVTKWAWVCLAKLIIGGGALIWALLFPLSDASTGVKVATMAAAVIVVGFYAWLLLHLGGFASRAWAWARRKKS